MIRFKVYEEEDYDKVIQFFVELNEDGKKHMNWNYARFEWMYKHPEFDKSLMHTIGLWVSDERVIGIAAYDMYYGEAYVNVLPEFLSYYEEIVKYAYENLKDDSGLGIAISDKDIEKQEIVKSLGFSVADQKETMMKFELSGNLSYSLPEDIHIEELDPAKDPEKFSYLLWQGFDHGDSFEECLEDFKNSGSIIQDRKHFNRNLSLSAVTSSGKSVAYVCVWYLEGTDYTYVEPVCTIPSFRNKGIAKALLYECLNRAYHLGAQEAFVISDMDFYQKLGFTFDETYTFYWKE